MKSKRTNVVLDVDLVQRAKNLTGIETTKGVVHEALETLVRLRGQALVRELRGQLKWEGDLAKQREGRGLATR